MLACLQDGVERVIRKLLQWLLGFLQHPQHCPNPSQVNSPTALTPCHSLTQDLGLSQPGRKLNHGTHR